MKYNTDIFIEKCKELHGDVYDYSLVEYTRLCDKVIIICNKHGKFEQRAQAHLMGSRCKSCYDESRNLTLDEFLEKANKVHNYKYEYKGYISLKKKMTIICKKHGEFKQVPGRHLSGNGCRKCYTESNRLTQYDFLQKSIEVHGYLYDYSKSEYINHSTKVCIICKKHGEFYQSPNNHICHKKGCPKCSINISKMEIDWLDSIGNDSIIRQYSILSESGKRYKVDGYDPSTKTIYEFYGDFWHGNINIYNKEDYNKVSNTKFIDLYNKTMEREDSLRKMGYNVISIWENDYKNNDKNI